MIIDGKNLCPSCFSETQNEMCDLCGYKSENISQYPIALPIGTILTGRYLIGKVLGKGGFGITYLAYDLNQNRRISIKEYLPDNLTHRDSGKTEVSTYSGEKGETFRLGAQKFFDEAKTVSKFNGHPNIINVYEFFYQNNTAYFVMEYLNGMDLRNYIINNGGCISEEKIKEIITPVIDALIVIHSIGILHRDISPDNIYICNDGNVKLLDFGAARQVIGEQSKSLSVVLKQGFAPIEQYQTKGRQGEWTDVYALGATIYYCLTGRIPESAMDRVDEDSLKQPSELGIKVTPEFEKTILKALSIRAINRYQTVAEFKRDFSKSDATPLIKIFPEPENMTLKVGAESNGNYPHNTIKALLNKKIITLSAVLLVVVIAAVILITKPSFNNKGSRALYDNSDQGILTLNPNTALADSESSTQNQRSGDTAGESTASNDPVKPPTTTQPNTTQPTATKDSSSTQKTTTETQKSTQSQKTQSNPVKNVQKGCQLIATINGVRKVYTSQYGTAARDSASGFCYLVLLNGPDYPKIYDDNFLILIPAYPSAGSSPNCFIQYTDPKGIMYQEHLNVNITKWDLEEGIGTGSFQGIFRRDDFKGAITYEISSSFVCSLIK